MPYVKLRPVGKGENPYRLPLLYIAVVYVPQLWPLILRIPLVPAVSEGVDTLLGPRLLLIPPCPTEGRVILPLIEGLPKGLRLHNVGIDAGAVIKGVDTLLHTLLVGMHYQIESVLLAKAVAEGDHVPELPGRINMKEREGRLGRIKRLEREMDKNRRVLPDGIEHHRVIEFRHHLTDDVDRFSLKLFEVSKVVRSHLLILFMVIVTGMENTIYCDLIRWR